MIAFFIPFFFVFLSPGIILALYFSFKEKIDLLQLILQIVIFGLAFQLALAILFIPIGDFTYNPPVTFFLLTACLLIITIIFTKAFNPNWWINNLKKINLSWYDFFTIIIIGVLFISFYLQISNLENPYFNTGDDKYQLLALAKHFTYKPSLVFYNQMINRFYSQGMALILAPYTLLLDDSLKNLQQLIINWQYFFYAFYVIALAQLGKKFLTTTYLGLLTPYYSLIYFGTTIT